MKRWMAVGGLLLALVTMASARQKWDGYCEQGGHAVTLAGMNSQTLVQQSFPGCTFTVYLAGTMTPATLYSDNAGTPKAYQFTADSTGYGFFYADNGHYDIRRSGAGITNPWTEGDVLLGDPAESATAQHNLLSSAHPDTTPATVLRGALVTGQGSTPKWTMLPLGSNGSSLCSNGGDAYWGNCSITAMMQQIVPPRTDLSYVILYPTSYTKYTGGNGTTSAIGSGSGFINRTHSSGLSDWDVWINWTGFALPGNVSAASVQYVYGVMVSSSNFFGGTHLADFGQGAPSFNAGILFAGGGFAALTNVGYGQSTGLLASGGAASSFNYGTTSVSADNAASLSWDGSDTWSIDSVALVVFYSGTQVTLPTAVQVVPPLEYNAALNTLSLTNANSYKIVDIGLMSNGTPAASQVLVRHPFPFPSTIPANCADTYGQSQMLAETAATATTVFSIQKCTAVGSCAQFGTATFAAGGTSAAFACTATSFDGKGQYLKVIAPATPDTSLQLMGGSIYGVRQ